MYLVLKFEYSLEAIKIVIKIFKTTKRDGDHWKLKYIYIQMHEHINACTHNMHACCSTIFNIIVISE